MPSPSETILAAALQLPETERLRLATQLLETVPDEPVGVSLDDPDLVDELRRRSGDLDGAVSWSKLRDEL